MIEASKTPRTDAELEAVKGDYRMNNSVSADFSRQLERELNEASKTIEQLKQNSPECGACAEGFWCGSTMHAHTCAIAQLDTALARVKELEAAMNKIRLEKHNITIPTEQCLYNCTNIADSAMQQGKETR